MGVLRLSVLGTPEIFHHETRLTFALRKAQALLLYLAVEGGMQPRSKLAAFLWPDSEPHDARTALRNALALLRTLLAEGEAGGTGHSHLLQTGDLLGLDPQAPLELDLQRVQQAYQQAQLYPSPPAEAQRAVLVGHLQQAVALVRGPFLDGFWLREEAPFDEWLQQQQHQWQVRLQLLFDRLSAWHEVALEHEQAQAVLTRWLALDPLQEEAYRRLMRVQLALGEPNAAWQVYASCRGRLAQALQVEPSPQTVALAERIRAGMVRGSRVAGTRAAPRARSAEESGPPEELVVPLVGRSGVLSQLVGRYQQAQSGQPQAVLVVGEAGMGKSRVAEEFVSWARAQGADVLRGQAWEAGGRLAYQPVVEAIRGRLEEENAPEDLLEDLWLAELGRLLPEVRVRYPDLPQPGEDEQMGRVHLCEAVARLVGALAARGGPLVVVLEDLHWADEASLDLLRYVGRDWSRHGAAVLLVGTVGWEALESNGRLAGRLADLGRDVALTQVSLQALSEAETRQVVEAVIEPEEEQGESGVMGSSPAEPEAQSALAAERPLEELSDFLYAQTGGQPLYLLEMLKLLRERRWLVPRRSPDGTWKLALDLQGATPLAQERLRRDLVPAMVRTLIVARLTRLSPAARQLVLVSAVLDMAASAGRLWQVADLGEQVGLEALEEAVGSGLLREEEGRAEAVGSYRCTCDLIRAVVYSELGATRRRLVHQRAMLLHSESRAGVVDEDTEAGLPLSGLLRTTLVALRSGSHALSRNSIQSASGGQ